MKVIRNKLIPFNGMKYINIFGVIFTKSKRPISEIELNHEMIHTKQMQELLYIPYYIIYLVEWLVRLPFKGEAYKQLSFEKEAYNNEKNLAYPKTRKHYAMWRKSK